MRCTFGEFVNFQFTVQVALLVLQCRSIPLVLLGSWPSPMKPWFPAKSCLWRHIKLTAYLQGVAKWLLLCLYRKWGGELEDREKNSGLTFFKAFIIEFFCLNSWFFGSDLCLNNSVLAILFLKSTHRKGWSSKMMLLHQMRHLLNPHWADLAQSPFYIKLDPNPFFTLPMAISWSGCFKGPTTLCSHEINIKKYDFAY